MRLVVREDNKVVCLVRETKGTKNFELLRNIKTDKSRCGRKHFDCLGMNFGVVTSVENMLDG